MKTETQRKYELMIIVDARLSNDEKEAVRREVTDNIVKAGSKVINSQIWLEKQKMAFSIKKCNEGTYYLVNIEGEPASVNSIRTNLRLNERVLRSAVTKID